MKLIEKPPVMPEQWQVLCDNPCLLCPELDCVLNGCRRKRTTTPGPEDGG